MHPATKEFSLSYTPSVALAAGLEVNTVLSDKVYLLKKDLADACRTSLQG